MASTTTSTHVSKVAVPVKVASSAIISGPAVALRVAAGSRVSQVISTSPTLLSASPALNLQGVRRVVHLDGSTEENAINTQVLARHRVLSADDARVTYGSVAAFRALPTEFVDQKESGYYKITGELVDEKVYEGRALVGELVDEKITEGRKLVGELVDEKITMGKVAVKAVEEVVHAAPLVRENVTVRELPGVVRSVNMSEPVYIRGAASEAVTTNTYVNIGEPVIHEYLAVTVNDGSPIFINNRAYRRTDAGYTPVNNWTSYGQRERFLNFAPGGRLAPSYSPSVSSASVSSSIPAGYRPASPVRLTPTFSSPAYRLQPTVHDTRSTERVVVRKVQ